MNKKTIKKNKATDFEDYLNEKMKDPIFKRRYDEFGKQLEIAYRLMQLRKEKRMSQMDLAKLIGTTQGNVARMESGRQNFTVGILNKVAEAFDKDLKISIC